MALIALTKNTEKYINQELLYRHTYTNYTAACKAAYLCNYILCRAKGKKMKTKMTRLKRYRLKHPRIDYYPSPDVSDIIKYHQDNSTEKCLVGIIDGLIRAGHRVVSGNR